MFGYVEESYRAWNLLEELIRQEYPLGNCILHRTKGTMICNKQPITILVEDTLYSDDPIKSLKDKVERFLGPRIEAAGYGRCLWLYKSNCNPFYIVDLRQIIDQIWFSTGEIDNLKNVLKLLFLGRPPVEIDNQRIIEFPEQNLWKLEQQQVDSYKYEWHIKRWKIKHYRKPTANFPVLTQKEVMNHERTKD